MIMIMITSVINLFKINKPYKTFFIFDLFKYSLYFKVIIFYGERYNYQFNRRIIAFLYHCHCFK
jgi:hypothetical protein